MRAAGLHAIETILTSEAVLIRSNKPADEHADLIKRITSRVAGHIAAGKYVLCNYNIARKNLEHATGITPGRRAATVSPLDDPEWVAVSSMVLKAEVADVMDRLQVSPTLFLSGVENPALLLTRCPNVSVYTYRLSEPVIFSSSVSPIAVSRFGPDSRGGSSLRDLR